MTMGVLRGEWLKLRSVRSTQLVFVAVVLLGLGVGIVDVAGVAAHWDTMSAADRAGFDAVNESFSGFQFGELAFGALGVLAISTEYGTGLIRTTFTAVPRRGVVFAAKALLLGGLALVVCELLSFAAFFAGQLLLHGKHLDVSLAAPGVLRAVLGAGLYMAVVTMVGFGLGGLIRHTAGAMVAMVGLTFLSYPAARALDSVSTVPDRLALPNIGQVLSSAQPVVGPHADRYPSFGLAALYLMLYLVVFLGLAAWRMCRDA